MTASEPAALQWLQEEGVQMSERLRGGIKDTIGDAIHRLLHPPMPENTRGENQKSGQGRLLVIEDNEDMCILLRLFLEEQGFAVSTMADGKQALRFIQNNPPVDTVLLDYMLPYVDGFQLLKVIRSTPAWQLTPVLMMSAKSDERDIVRMLKAGANDYMLKPLSLQEVLAKVARMVHPGQQPEARPDLPLAG